MFHSFIHFSTFFKPSLSLSSSRFFPILISSLSSLVYHNYFRFRAFDSLFLFSFCRPVCKLLQTQETIWQKLHRTTFVRYIYIVHTNFNEIYISKYFHYTLRLLNNKHVKSIRREKAQEKREMGGEKVVWVARIFELKEHRSKDLN